jgi:hypothetical protein
MIFLRCVDGGIRSLPLARGVIGKHKEASQYKAT